MSVVTQGNLNLTATQTKDEDQGQASFPATLGVVLALTNGTGANQVDLLFSDQRTTATEELDLAGVLTDVYGATITMARVKGILIKAASANTVDIHLGGGSNPFFGFVADATDEVVIRAGGAAFFWAPDATAMAVTAATGDILKVAASDGSTPITYDIMIIGASA